jgi:DNA polymerase-4
VVSVRFETRGSGPGPTRTFAIDTPALSAADAIDSQDWGDYLGALRRSAPAGDDLGDG